LAHGKEVGRNLGSDQGYARADQGRQRAAKSPGSGEVGMSSKLLDVFFGCWHHNLSFPMTAKSGKRRITAASLTGTYVVCLDCGKEFAYDWREMKIVEEATEPAAVRDLATKEAA
jgi:hypothetical protein